MHKTYDLNSFIYNPTDVALDIKHPTNQIKFPISNKLLQIYNKSINNEDFTDILDKHYKNYLILEELIVKQSLHNTMVYNLAPDNYKIALNEPEKVRSEFYTVIYFPTEFQRKIKDGENIKFSDYLNLLGKIL